MKSIQRIVQEEVRVNQLRTKVKLTENIFSKALDYINNILLTSKTEEIIKKIDSEHPELKSAFTDLKNAVSNLTNELNGMTKEEKEKFEKFQKTLKF